MSTRFIAPKGYITTSLELGETTISQIVTRGYLGLVIIPGVDVIVGRIASVTAVNASLVIPVVCDNTFNQELGSDIDDTFLSDDEFTVEGIYTDVDGESYALYGIFDDPYALSQPDTEIGLQSIGPTFKCKLSDIEDVSGGVQKGDKILICEREYRIQESQPDGVGLTVLTLKFP